MKTITRVSIVFPLILAAYAGCRTTTPDVGPTLPTVTPPVADIEAGVSSLTNDPDVLTQAVDAVVQSVAPTAPVAQPAGPVAIVAGERRAVPSPSPRVQIVSPAANVTLREDRLEVRLNVQNWRDVSNTTDMRHVHLVLDGNPYIRVDDPSRPVVLEHLTQGTHVLRAFPGWETHETIKEPGAYAVAIFHVGAPTRPAMVNPRAPMLTYSRPKGRIEGASANHFLLDFYLANVSATQMGPQGYRVRPSIDGQAMTELTAWVPYFIDNLPDGEHTIGLDLLGPNGQIAPGPFNHSEQRITVSRTPAPVAAAAPAAPDPHAGH
jgi:hypothetical protein